MRKFDATYRISEADDVLVKENVIHEDLDRRLDDVERLADDFREGNRIDVEALIARYNLTVADLAAAVKDVLDQVEKGFPAAMVVESSSLQFLTPARRASIISEILGGADDNADTLAKVFAVADSRVTAGELAESVSELSRDLAARISDLKGGAPASRDTLMELSTAIDGVANDLAAAVAALKGGAPANRDTLKEISDAVDAVAASVATVNAKVSAITAGSTAARDTLKEVSDALDTLSATVAGLTAGAAASRDTFVEVGTILDTQNAAINNRLRFDAAQTLTSAQADQAATNALLNDRFARIDGQNIGPLGGRNKFVNGAFDVWQRGAVLGPANFNGKYLCDMVGMLQNSNATYTVQKFNDTDDNKNKFLIQSAVVDAAQTLGVLKFVVEDVRTLAGKRVAVSFSLKKYGAVADFSLPQHGVLRQYFGTGGSALVAAAVLQQPADLLVTATEKRFTYIFNFATLAGKTIGAGTDNSIYFFIYLPLGIDLRMLLSEFQIEEIGALGLNIATPFERRSSAEYLALCQRYYEKSYDLDVPPGTSTAAGAAYTRAQVTGGLAQFGTIRYAVPKRANPAVTFYSPESGSSTSPVRNVSASTDGTLVPANLGQGGFGGYTQIATTAGDHLRFHWTADASLTI